MAVTEESRYELHKYFEDTMGSQRASTVMELLPPVDWGDVATKQDLHQAVERLEARMATREDLFALKLEFGDFQAKMLDKMNKHFLALMGVHTTFLGLCIGLVTVLR